MKDYLIDNVLGFMALLGLLVFLVWIGISFTAIYKCGFGDWMIYGNRVPIAYLMGKCG